MADDNDIEQKNGLTANAHEFTRRRKKNRPSSRSLIAVETVWFCYDGHAQCGNNGLSLTPRKELP